MTPEELAEQAYRDLYHVIGTKDNITAIIAAALRAYGAECAAQERERCSTQLEELARWYLDQNANCSQNMAHALRRARRHVEALSPADHP